MSAITALNTTKHDLDFDARTIVGTMSIIEMLSRNPSDNEDAPLSDAHLA
jgi:hypothetical protein